MGKTAVFVLSILHMIKPEKGAVQALVMTHTRELAKQVIAAKTFSICVVSLQLDEGR